MRTGTSPTFFLRRRCVQQHGTIVRSADDVACPRSVTYTPALHRALGRYRSRLVAPEVVSSHRTRVGERRGGEVDRDCSSAVADEPNRRGSRCPVSDPVATSSKSPSSHWMTAMATRSVMPAPRDVRRSGRELDATVCTARDVGRPAVGFRSPGVGTGSNSPSELPSAAPVAQRIERRFPKPCAQVRVLPGAPTSPPRERVRRTGLSRCRDRRG